MDFDVMVAEQGCCQDLSVITSSLHTLLVECGKLLIALETQDSSRMYLAHDKLSARRQCYHCYQPPDCLSECA